MGGEYYRTSIGSDRTQASKPKKPSTPRWQTQVKKFFDTGELTTLVNAYNGYNKKQGSGFFLELLKHNELSTGLNEWPEIEYEVKIEIIPEGTGEEPSIEEYLRAFQFPPTKNARFLLDEMENVMPGNNHFFGAGADERLVVIEKNGGLYLKEKSGQPIPLETEVAYQELVVKRREVRVPATFAEVMEKMSEVRKEGNEYQGFIEKEKGDNFVLDTLDGRIYSFTVTRAHLNGKGGEVQRQLELEYAGFIPGFSGLEEGNEQQMIEGIVQLAKYVCVLNDGAQVTPDYKMRLRPTHERKYDFVADMLPEKKEYLSTPLLEMVGVKA